ncbi:MAG: response regulator [Candidatus Omnitrophica bacterium]|nr:response regulator [Candidatus Omnitrophota bacterium]
MEKKDKILIVDDEKDILSSLRRVFINEDFEAFFVCTYKEAMKVLNTKPIKVVMSDQRMPDVTGIDLLKEVKDKFPNIVRILFTGYAQTHLINEAFDVAGVYKFISKPWSTEQLKETVYEAIDEYNVLARAEKNKDE